MEEQDNKKNPLRGKFPGPGNTTGTGDNGYSEEAGLSSMQYYAIGSKEEMHFDLILRSGTEHSIPYPVLPFLRLEGNSEITIRGHELLIAIHGRNLRPIRDHLKEGTLIWVKESPGGKDDGKAKVFVSDIFAEGKAISKSLE